MSASSAFSLSLASFSACFFALFCSPLNGQLTEQDQQLLDWYDELGLENCTMLPIVKVSTGRWSRTVGEEPVNSYQYGFLASQTNDEFTIYSLEMKEEIFKKTLTGIPDHEIVDFVELDLEKYVQAMLQEHEARKHAEREPFRRFGRQLSEAGELLVLARACASHDEPELAHKLLMVAKEVSDKTRDVSLGKVSLKDGLAIDLAHSKMWHAILNFGDADIPRQEVYEDLMWLQKHFPDSSHFERAKASAEILAKMIEENLAHVVPADFDSLSTEKKVAELIFRLRDQNGHQFSQPGSCDIFSRDRMNEDGAELSPAGQLVEIGFEAVPQLIEILEDRQFTRSVGYHRDFYFSHHVLRVGDCAERIISRISMRRFYVRTHTNGAMAKDGEAETVKEQIEKWWSEVQSKGEKAVLIESVELGDDNSANQAIQLVEKYREEALPAIISGAKKAKSTWVRQRLINQAGEFKDEASNFLMDEMTNGPVLRTRLAAAQELATTNKPVAITAMIKEWSGLLLKKKKKTQISGAPFPDDFDSSDGDSEYLIRFLVSSGEIAAIKAIHDDYGQHSAKVRFSVVSSLRPKAAHDGGSEIDETVEREIESLLVTALADEERRIGLSGSFDDIPYSDPRICDMSGYIISQRLPEKYEFDFNGSFKIREKRRIDAINVWRNENSMELLPSIEFHKVDRLPGSATAPVLERVVNAETELDRTTSLAELEQLGIGALPAIIEALESMSSEHPSKSKLKELSARASTLVTLVTITEKYATPNDALRQRIESFENKPLTATRIIDLLSSVAESLPEGATGIKIEANRFEATNGFELKITLPTQFRARSGSQRMWGTNFHVSINQKVLLNTGGSLSVDYVERSGIVKGFGEKITNALESPSDSTIEMRFSLIKDE